jgi:hypothetical protein
MVIVYCESRRKCKYTLWDFKAGDRYMWAMKISNETVHRVRYILNIILNCSGLQRTFPSAAVHEFQRCFETSKRFQK